MKTKIFAALFCAALLAGFASVSNAQTMYFCEDVSKDGDPITQSTVFNISPNGGYLKILVKLPYSLRSSQVMYDVYQVDSDGNESFDNTIYQDTESSWDWFWKEVTFYKTGRYNVYVYDRDRNFLTSGQVVINYKD